MNPKQMRIEWNVKKEGIRGEKGVKVIISIIAFFFEKF